MLRPWVCKRRCIVPLVAAGILSLAGCALATTQRPQVVAYEDATLSGVRAALSLSPQTAGLEKGLPGYIALFSTDGTYQLLETKGMNQGRLEYTNGALHFSDYEFDYVLRDTLTRLASPKPNLQEASYVLPSNGSVIGLYNEGFTEDGYQEVLVTVSADGAQSDATKVEGAYWLTSQCGDEIFGVAPASGSYLAGKDRHRFESGDGQARNMLARLSPGAPEQLIGISESVMEDVTPGGLAPCIDGCITTPSYNVTGGLLGNNVAVLKTWDTANGALSETPLTFVNEEIALTHEAVLFAKMVASPVDGKLIWVLNDGRVLATEIETGSTSVLTKTPAFGSEALIYLDQRAGSIWCASGPTPEHPDFVITQIDPIAGTAHEVFRSDGFGALLGVDLVARDFVLL